MRRAALQSRWPTSQGTAAKGTEAKGTEGGAAAVATGVAAPVGGAPLVVCSRGRSRWFVVEADPANPEHGPMAVVSGHTSQKAATAALGRARGRASSRTSSGVGEGAVLQVRRRPDQLPASGGQPGRAGRRAARAAAVTARLTAERRDRARRL